MLFYVDTNSAADGLRARPRALDHGQPVPWSRVLQRFTGSTAQVEPCLLLCFPMTTKPSLRGRTLRLPVQVKPPNLTVGVSARNWDSLICT